jgi:hypothetical protein
MNYMMFYEPSQLEEEVLVTHPTHNIHDSFNPLQEDILIQLCTHS